MATTGQIGNPILQIVHISDLHFHTAGAPQNDGLVKSAIAVFGAGSASFRQWLLDYWEDGRAGHATDALIAFECFLTGDPMPNEKQGTPPYPRGIDTLRPTDIPTWLVDTGDLASMGDDASVRAELAWVNNVAALLSIREVVRLYGNHDAWPTKFPLIASKATLRAHRTYLRNNHFPARRPLPPISQPIDAAGNRIELYALNSIIHDKWHNIRARGRIERDPHWLGARQEQLAKLTNLVKRSALHKPGRAFRILLTHHPVHYPPKRPSWKMSMLNDTQVAQHLQTGPSIGVGPLAHLVLSGHTHRLYPAHGTLPPNAGFAYHPPLGLHQLQLVVGSLSKAIRHSPGVSSGPRHDANGEPHQFQVLRFFSVSGHPQSLVMKRALIGRDNGTGRFEFKKTDAGDIWETAFLEF